MGVCAARGMARCFEKPGLGQCMKCLVDKEEEMREEEKRLRKKDKCIIVISFFLSTMRSYFVR
jgi:hypothetical protein